MVPPGSGDDDLELALSLHRELNGLTRRSRSQPKAAYEGALQKLKRKHHHQHSEAQTSSGSGRRSSKKQKTHTSSEGGPPPRAWVL